MGHPTQKGYALPRPSPTPEPEPEQQEVTEVDRELDEDEPAPGLRGRRPPLHIEVVHVQGAASLVE